MDIRELMIGNIVCSNGKPMNTYKVAFYKIVSIDSQNGNNSGSVVLETNLLWKGDTVGAWADFIEPIPLSEKMLFKLGFKKEEEEVIHVYEYNLCVNN